MRRVCELRCVYPWGNGTLSPPTSVCPIGGKRCVHDCLCVNVLKALKSFAQVKNGKRWLFFPLRMAFLGMHEHRNDNSCSHLENIPDCIFFHISWVLIYVKLCTWKELERQNRIRQQKSKQKSCWNGKYKDQAINKFALTVIRYPTEMITWSQEEIEISILKLVSMYWRFHLVASTARLYRVSPLD